MASQLSGPPDSSTYLLTLFSHCWQAQGIFSNVSKRGLARPAVQSVQSARRFFSLTLCKARTCIWWTINKATLSLQTKLLPLTNYLIACCRRFICALAVSCEAPILPFRRFGRANYIIREIYGRVRCYSKYSNCQIGSNRPGHSYLMHLVCPPC